MSYRYVLKPDVMAPGSFMLGAWHPKLLAAKVGLNLSLYHNYNIESGTSLACAHVTGVVTLLKGKYPNWSPAAIRSAIMTTVNPLDNNLNLVRDNGNDLQFASPIAMGAGCIDPNQALHHGLIYNVTTQDYIDLLCSKEFY